MAGRTPMRSVHIADHYGDERVHCGRKPKWGERFHSSWPLCKTCKRVLAAKGKSWSVFTEFDADGWSVVRPNFVLTTNSSNTATLTTQTVWFYGRDAA